MRTTQPHNDSKIKIAYVLRTEVRAGVEEHVLSLIKNINPRRFKTYIVAPPELIKAFGDDLDSTKATILPLRIRSLLDLKSMIAFFRFLRQEEIDIVNTHMFFTSLHFSPIAKLAGIPVLLETSHGVEKWRLGKGFIKRHSFILDRTLSILQTKILAVSQACKRDLIKIKKINPAKIRVVQNGRDFKTFSPIPVTELQQLRRQFSLKPDDYVFGIQARLDFQKGHKYLFNAVRSLANQRKDFKVLVVGDGILREELQKQVANLNIQDHIIFAGFQTNIPRFLGIMDVKVLPSLYEGLPLGVIEALAMEKPVIATAVDGTPEVLTHNETGLLVPPKDSEALCKAMMFALDHKEKMREMGKKGRLFVLKHFTLERQIQETERLYEELISRTRKKEKRKRGRFYFREKEPDVGVWP